MGEISWLKRHHFKTSSFSNLQGSTHNALGLLKYTHPCRKQISIVMENIKPSSHWYQIKSKPMSLMECNLKHTRCLTTAVSVYSRGLRAELTGSTRTEIHAYTSLETSIPKKVTIPESNPHTSSLIRKKKYTWSLSLSHYREIKYHGYNLF